MKKEESYRELLKDPRWIKRRNEILSRDNNTCQFCGCQDKYMHVHHKQYWNGHLPWEYPDNMLVTLCEDCHSFMHQYKDKDCSIEIGQVYKMYHSDWTNTCIVYNVDYEKELVYTLECDDGAGESSIFGEVSHFSYFNQHYTLDESSFEYDSWFSLWLSYVSKHLSETPMKFRYRWEEILSNNPLLLELINNPVDYE